MLSEHFSLEEMTRTATGFENEPDVEAGANFVTLCETLLEPARALLNSPFLVHSGYRSASVNAKVGGARNSAHLYGRACDFVPSAWDIHTAFETLAKSSLPYDKILLEQHDGNWWIHLQIPSAGNQPRREAYTAIVTDTGTAYHPWSPQ